MFFHRIHLGPYVCTFTSHGDMYDEFSIGFLFVSYCQLYLTWGNAWKFSHYIIFLPFHISTFASHEKMHEEFLITLYLPFCRVNFHIKWGRALGICLWLPICLFILSTMIRRKVLSPLKPSPNKSIWLATFAIYSRNMQIHLFFTLYLGLLSPPNISFSDIHKVRKFLLSLSMKCWNSAKCKIST
jgi:hypothetical protein